MTQLLCFFIGASIGAIFSMYVFKEPPHAPLTLKPPVQPVGEPPIKGDELVGKRKAETNRWRA